MGVFVGAFALHVVVAAAGAIHEEGHGVVDIERGAALDGKY